jgi:hypothetical protein
MPSHFGRGLISKWRILTSYHKIIQTYLMERLIHNESVWTKFTFLHYFTSHSRGCNKNWLPNTWQDLHLLILSHGEYSLHLWTVQHMQTRKNVLVEVNFKVVTETKSAKYNMDSCKSILSRPCERMWTDEARRLKIIFGHGPILLPSKLNGGFLPTSFHQYLNETW